MFQTNGLIFSFIEINAVSRTKEWENNQAYLVYLFSQQSTFDIQK
jgi:hypothetical protein